MTAELHTTSVFDCPFCGAIVHVVEREGDDDPAVAHPMPICTAYDAAEDALDFVSKARNEMQRKLGVS